MCCAGATRRTRSQGECYSFSAVGAECYSFSAVGAECYSFSAVCADCYSFSAVYVSADRACVIDEYRGCCRVRYIYMIVLEGVAES